jgi:hypothetical protein
MQVRVNKGFRLLKLINNSCSRCCNVIKSNARTHIHAMSGGDTAKDTTSMLQAAWMADLRRGSPNESGRPNSAPVPKDSIPAYIQQLDSAFQNKELGVATSSAKPKWYFNTIFLHACTCLAVFLLTFVIVILIRPPFLNKRKNEDDPMAAPKFSPTNAVYMALVTTGVAVLLMVIVAFVKNNKKGGGDKSSGKPVQPKSSLFSFNRTQ